jgi:predicted transcriptional regulator
MLKLKALYNKMMDDLKDSGMWIEWAYELRDSDPEAAKFLMASANERLEKTYVESKKMFMDSIKDDKSMLKELVKEHIDGWCMEMKEKIKSF